MADTISVVERYAIDLPDQVGEGARVLGALAEGGANLIAAWGYPTTNGMARLEVVPADAAQLKEAARKGKIKLGKKMSAFLIQGRDKAGALCGYMGKLAAAGINVYAAQGVSAGKQYGAVIWVDSKDARKAAKALGV